MEYPNNTNNVVILTILGSYYSPRIGKEENEDNMKEKEGKKDIWSLVLYSLDKSEKREKRSPFSDP